MSAEPESPEKVDWRFRSNFNSTGSEFWAKSIKWLDQPEEKKEREFEQEGYAGKGGMIGRYQGYQAPPYQQKANYYYYSPKRYAGHQIWDERRRNPSLVLHRAPKYAESRNNSETAKFFKTAGPGEFNGLRTSWMGSVNHGTNKYA